jgi:dTDP-4-dehydrorhamnose reductase
LKKIDRILGTGAAGLMGPSLAEHLLAEGYENVISLERARCDLIDTPATFAQVERLRPEYVAHRYDAASRCCAEHQVMNDSVGGAEAGSWANHGE